MERQHAEHDNFFVTIPRVTCKTPEKLLGSKGVRGVLEIFNHDPETGEEVTLESLQSSFRDFERVRAYFEQFKVQGHPRDIQKLMHLVDEIGSRVKRLDTSYKLPEGEVRERFSRLGVDLPKVLEDWTSFYNKIRYRDALAQTGEWEKQEPYDLPLPQVCEAEMQAFEEALRANRGMEIMVDDARLTPSETFNLFQRRPNKKSDPITSVRLVQALPVTPQMVQQYLEEKEASEPSQDEKDPATVLQELHARLLKDYENDLHRGVRLVAYDPEATGTFWGIAHNKKGLVNEAEKIKRAVNFMEIGTFMRLCKYLEARGGNTLYRFLNYINDREQGYVPLTTMTANVAPDGNVFAADYNSTSRRFDIRKVDPSGKDRHFGDIVREVVQTKI